MDKDIKNSQLIHDRLSESLMRLQYELRKSIQATADNELRQRVEDLERQIAELKGGAL